MKKDQQIQKLATVIKQVFASLKTKIVIIIVFVCMFTFSKKEYGERHAECRGGEQLGIGHLLESLS